MDPLSVGLISAVVGVFTVAAAVPSFVTRYLLRRARCNREGRCGACGSYLPFTADAEGMFVMAGTYLCRRCGGRGRLYLRRAAFAVTPTLFIVGGVTVLAILNSGLPLSWWLGGRLLFALLPSFGVTLGLVLVARGVKRANVDPVVPAYDSVMEALDSERERRESWALPRA